MVPVPRTIHTSHQEAHRKPRKPLSQLSFLAQKSTYAGSGVRTVPGWPTSRSMTSIGLFFYFVFIHSQVPKIFLGRFSAGSASPSSLNSSPTRYIYIYMYLESDMLDLRPRVCFGSQAKSAFGTTKDFHCFSPKKQVRLRKKIEVREISTFENHYLRDPKNR